MNSIESLGLHELTLPFGQVRALTRTFGLGLHLVVGPNGIGKTSLLRAIAGALSPMTGVIRLGDVPMKRHSDRVLLAPGAPPAIPWLRAGMLIDFVTSLYPSSRRSLEYRTHVLEQLHLSHAVDAPLGTLSAGMSKKILLAATLIAAPLVMLFDEPINEIDAASRDVLLTLLADYQRDRIMLVSTHHVDPFREVAASMLTLGETGVPSVS
ncbi:ATP-binding cassette domain-containing protein [Oleiagrimonas sp. MCCC 1A03011]|uniref:ABC transporter ATP-binding protein n=1 Tax=Oleiagrimonas sp. MCCC 1A03011 TaxID=1926883 RepID=UPI000DC20CFD|nr:ATP-binding cassette domain-containing protein [Oleiagrimonas sp. MCCC 1A03011]RAP58028.1 hypothetical protein BTJ49_09300 [Oleiagrimonas sp. MCCC 1A03011]